MKLHGGKQQLKKKTFPPSSDPRRKVRAVTFQANELLDGYRLLIKKNAKTRINISQPRPDEATTENNACISSNKQ